MAMGFVGLVFLISGIRVLWQAATSNTPLLFIPYTIIVGLGLGFGYVMLALRHRRNWARHVAVVFWALGLAWSSYSILRNGLYPNPPTGPFTYDNDAQLAGARFATLVTPYFLAVGELSMIYCLLRKSSVVKQFAVSDNREPAS